VNPLREIDMARRGSTIYEMSGAPRVTIRDVAAAAGVSVTTVSHALNGKGRIDARTRERVLTAAQRLSYSPSRVARSLRGGRTQTIALLLPSLGAASTDTALGLDNYMRIVSSAADGAHRRRYGLLLLPPEPSSDDLRHAGLDGAIVVDPSVRDRRLDRLADIDIPVVTIERDRGRPELDWHVSLDAGQGVTLILRHLREQQARDVCMLAPDADWAYSTNLIDAFQRLAPGYDLRARVIPVAMTNIEGAAHQVASLVLDSTAIPDAIVAVAERFAAGVTRAAQERGVRIPEDLLLISGADSYHAREARPAVSALDMQPELTAAEAVDMLISRLEGAESEKPRVIPYKLLVRESSQRRVVSSAIEATTS
jgi:DNA-binding LacI/PurR family transcriptional regulator